MQARHIDPIEQKGLSVIAQVLIWGGVLLLLLGAVLVYPYVTSRLSSVPPATFRSSGQDVHRQQQRRVPPSNRHIRPTLPGSPAIGSSMSAALLDEPADPPLPLPTPAPALPTRLVIPIIGVDAPVVPISWGVAQVKGQTLAAWEVPAGYAAGWHVTSASLGYGGNTVLNGHNATNGEVFRDLHRLEAGDAIVVYADSIPHPYTVSETLILREAGQPLEKRIDNAQYILPTDDERLTIVTCHPYGSLRYRLIVIARPPVVAAESEDEVFPMHRIRH